MRLVMTQKRRTLRRPLKPLQLLLVAGKYLVHLFLSMYCHELVTVFHGSWNKPKVTLCVTMLFLLTFYSLAQSNGT